MTESTLTPMLRQYQELKRQHPSTLLFFRLGDFYELFFDDAITGAREMEITLTARHKERGTPIPMCGVPHHAVSTYVARLVRKGYRVAICEQTEEPTKTKKLVRREIVRVITPGTAIDPQLVEARECVYLAAVCGAGDAFGAAFLDLSTGEFRATEARGQDAWPRIRADIESYSPRELLFPDSLSPLIKDGFTTRDRAATLPLVTPIRERISNNSSHASDSNDASEVDEANSATRTNESDAPNEPDASSATSAADETQRANESSDDVPRASNVVPFPRPVQSDNAPFGGCAFALTPLDDWLWEPLSCASQLLEQLGARTLEGYGLSGHDLAVAAAGAVLRYARETQRESAAHVNDITFFESQDHLILDAVTIRNLELVESQSQAGRAHTLLGVIDETLTGMGARLLRSWLLRPSIRRGEIEARLGAVEELQRSQMRRDRLRAPLKEIADLERLIARVNMNTATPRDLNALRRSLDQVPAIRQSLSDSESSLLQILLEGADELADVRALLARAISDDAPLNLSDLGAIRDGYSAELDELRAVSRDAKQTIAALEARERTRSGIASLRVRFNNVFGYYIEVSKGAAARVPADYERRQTLANAERFSTPELKDYERRILGAEDRMRELEATLYAEVRASVARETKRLQATARALATLDALAGLAEVAARRRYAKPQLHDADEIEIRQGRHPVIEAHSDAPFVPNDLYMNNSTDRLLIITGPNMGGKSTILRQLALISILAQAGSFVPAEHARLPILDRVWTRVGASDDLARGRSTFMVEMTETAAILHNATPRSLVLLDEIGRGTATFDGLSIAWAVAEYLHDSPEHAAKTLFATHYHELTELAERLPGAQNYRIRVAEREGEVVFLYRIERGRASKSYGIEVARLAGLPPDVLTRARDVLQRLERYELDVFTDEINEQPHAATTGSDAPPSSQHEQNGDGLAQVASRARRRALAAQATLFDAVNQSLLDELRASELEKLSPEEIRALLIDLRKRIV
jgi:DNA mismatch repair protein MutS